MIMIPARAEPSCISPILTLQRFGFAKAHSSYSCHFKPARCIKEPKSALQAWLEHLRVVLGFHPCPLLTLTLNTYAYVLHLSLPLPSPSSIPLFTSYFLVTSSLSRGAEQSLNLYLLTFYLSKLDPAGLLCHASNDVERLANYF